LLDAPGGTARQALLPDIAETSGMKLEQANAAQQTVQRGAMLVGPAIAGGLIVWLGSSNVLWLDAATFVVSAILFALAIPSGQAEPIAKSGYIQQLKEGLLFIRQDRLLFTLVATVAITNFLDSPIFAVILPVFAKETFGEATQLGFMLSAFGAGAVLGTVFFGIFGDRLPRRWTFVISFILVGIPFWILAMAPPYPIVLAALFFAGIAAGPLNPLLMTVSQERIPAEMRGRVFGMITAMALMAAPLGMVVSGYAVEYFSVSLTLILIASCYLLVTVVQALNPALREMDRPANGS
jgi:MFS family permease